MHVVDHNPVQAAWAICKISEPILAIELDVVMTLLEFENNCAE